MISMQVTFLHSRKVIHHTISFLSFFFLTQLHPHPLSKEHMASKLRGFATIVSHHYLQYSFTALLFFRLEEKNCHHLIENT